MKQQLLDTLKIERPILQGGMVWVSGWKLVTAVSDCGGLGILGAGSMYPEMLRSHIQKCKNHSNKPFAVNIPLLYPDMDTLISVILEEAVPIVFTSAGDPSIWTAQLQKKGIVVGHVVPSLKFAQKAEAAGVDIIVAEGFEAGGHNGRDETTTFALIPHLKKHLKVPLVAAGGIATGAQMLAAEVLGADGVQIGSLFVASKEASCHINFKEAVVKAGEGDTQLTLKEIAPVRLMKNKLYDKIINAYQENASLTELKAIASPGLTKRGIFEGDTENGKTEIGQVASLITGIPSVAQLFNQLLVDYEKSKERMSI